jgi:hypothetical protein
LVIFVADGAGSAERGGAGADLAVEVATELMHREYAKSEQLDLCSELAGSCLGLVRERIGALAEHEGRVVRDYACTLLGVVATPSQAMIMQLGDGGIVIDFGAGLEVPVAPPVAEYVNMTHFVTDADASERLQILIREGLARRIAVFSDGLQRLALNVAANTPHDPFFLPFFQTLSSVAVDQEDLLHEKLVGFLESQRVNERTDDDKTLALAHWIE